MELRAFSAAPQLGGLELLGKLEAREPLAVARTDDRGAFSLVLGAGYEGGPLALELWANRVPHQPLGGPVAPRGLPLGWLRPAWQRVPAGLAARWDTCIGALSWERLRAGFDARVLCGQVCGASSGVAYEGVLVTALWRHGAFCERIGAARTDAAGRFRLDYLGAEQVARERASGGGKLAFRLTSPSGAPMALDASTLGRTWDMARTCLCLRLRASEPTTRALGAAPRVA
jgi:hypothetical protein